jgi:hypothetical protein
MTLGCMEVRSNTTDAPILKMERVKFLQNITTLHTRLIAFITKNNILTEAQNGFTERENQLKEQFMISLKSIQEAIGRR